MAMGQKILQDDAVIAQPLWHSILSAITKQVRDYATHPSLYTIATVSGSCDVRQRPWATPACCILTNGVSLLQTIQHSQNC